MQSDLSNRLASLPFASEETFEPSAPNRFRFGFKMLLAVAVGVVGFLLLDSDKQSPLPQLLLTAAVMVGLPNLHALLSPPYLRLNHQGIELRVWHHYSMNWSALLACVFLPFRKYTTVTIPWGDLIAIKPFKEISNGVFVSEHKLTVDYFGADGRSHSIAFSRGIFALTPLELSIAIQEHRDREFRWKPLRASGGLETWVGQQQRRFQQPVTMRFLRRWLVVGLGLSGLFALGSAIVSEVVLHVFGGGPAAAAAYYNWISTLGATGALAFFLSSGELMGWLMIGSRRTVVLSADGLSLGEPEMPITHFSWEDVVTARLRYVNRTFNGEESGTHIDGLDVSFADGRRLYLPNSYDFSLEELESILTPSERELSMANS